MRRAAKRDTIEDAIIDALHAAGRKVQVLSQGGGVPDLLVRQPDGTWLVIEVKSPGGRLTPQQQKWCAYYGAVPIVQTPEDAIAAVMGDADVALR
jgi:hypothetical protein